MMSEETRCYEECSNDDYVMLESEDGNGMICRAVYVIRDNEEHSSKDYCIEYCNENRGSMGCRPEWLIHFSQS